MYLPPFQKAYVSMDGQPPACVVLFFSLSIASRSPVVSASVCVAVQVTALRGNRKNKFYVYPWRL